MSIENLRFLPLPNSNPNEVEIVAQDTKTGKILGHVQAKAEQAKGYGGEKIPQPYINPDTSTTYRKIAKPHMYIIDIFVEENARHQGIGKKLLGKIVQESSGRGYKGRTMLVGYNAYETSPLPFYGKLGFISGDKFTNKQIKDAIRTNTPIKNARQTLMALTSGGIQKLLKAVR